MPRAASSEPATGLATRAVAGPAIFLFTDFGWQGPYVGQMKAAIGQIAPQVPVIDLMHDAPAFSPRPAAYLLAALLDYLPRTAVVCAVVDPGVGGDRPPVIVEVEGRTLVGPGNGLFAIALSRSEYRSVRRIDRAPVKLSASFHGRDLFAPTAARLAVGEAVHGQPLEGDMPGADWPTELGEVVYVDGFGNAMTGFSAERLGERALIAGGRRLRRVRTFIDCAPGEAFWYQNSIGLAEIAVSRGSAAAALDLEIGSHISLAP